MQNDTPITENWSRSKPEVEIQHGGCLYFETGSGYISAANGAILTKFGMLTDFDLVKAVTSTNTKLEYLAVEAAILGNGYDVNFRIGCSDLDEIR